MGSDLKMGDYVNDHNQTLTHIRIDDLTNAQYIRREGSPNYGVNMAGRLEVLSDVKQFCTNLRID